MPCLENTSTEAVVNYYDNSVFIYLKNDESFDPNSTHKELADCLHNRTAPASVQVIDGPISESSKHYNIVGQGERDNSFDYDSYDATDSTGASSDYSTDFNQGMVAIGDESNGVMRPISNYKRDIAYATFHGISSCSEEAGDIPVFSRKYYGQLHTHDVWYLKKLMDIGIKKLMDIGTFVESLLSNS
ncbi:hypothetical protein JA9_003579 [Meyerozyma sp. JA9]|nr:hypothetical protein JA9_003579 [Meyerozyma sp. JA9]